MSVTSDLSTAAHLTTLRWVSSLENGWMDASWTRSCQLDQELVPGEKKRSLFFPFNF